MKINYIIKKTLKLTALILGILGLLGIVFLIQMYPFAKGVNEDALNYKELRRNNHVPLKINDSTYIQAEPVPVIPKTITNKK